MRERPLVIVVEDDEEMNQLERELLDMGGLDTVPAYTGPEALEVARRTRPRAVLLDLMLPEMDGLETCRILRSRSGSQLAIVVVTALDGDETRRRTIECGADACFAKPFNPDDVIDTLRSLIHTHAGAAAD